MIAGACVQRYFKCTVCREVEQRGCSEWGTVEKVIAGCRVCVQKGLSRRRLCVEGVGTWPIKVYVSDMG
jgi:hypothetical protein